MKNFLDAYLKQDKAPAHLLTTDIRHRSATANPGKAVEIFRMATRLYPNHWNLYDSLAEPEEQQRA